METIKIILRHKIDLALIVLFGFGLVIGIMNDAPTITSGSCLFAIGNVSFNLINKVKLIKSGVLDKLEK